MLIEPFETKYQQEVIDLVLYCQNDEYHLNISLKEQLDLLSIKESYFETGGHFWVCLIDDHVVGCIGLLKKNSTVAILKKFFVYKNYRGAPFRVGNQLYQLLLAYAKQTQLKQIILDTPASAKRSHNFYQKVGFTDISFEALPVKYDFPDRASLFFSLTL